MKKILLLVLLLVIIATQSQSQTKSANPAKSQTKDDLIKVLDNMYLAYNTKDIKLFLSLMADDGLYCGTDSKDLWHKDIYSKRMTELFADTSFHSQIKVDKREILMAKDHKSAIVVDQFFFEWNKNIPVRHIVHFVRNENKWRCNFLSTTFVPNDADLDKIFKAVR